MIESLLMLGGVFFWCVLIVYAVFVAGCIEEESYSPVIFITVVFGICYTIWGEGFSIIKYFWNNPIDLFYGVLSYLFIGAGYSVIKWVTFVHKLKKEYFEKRKIFLENNNLTSLDDDMTEVMKSKYRGKTVKEVWEGYNGNYDSIVGKMSPHNNKSSIMMWIAYWPICSLFTFIAEPLSKVVSFIRSSLNTVYVAIMRRATVDIEKDFKEK
jgi:hypothetical protein